MIWLIIILVLCIVAYFGIEPYKQYRDNKKKAIQEEIRREKIEVHNRDLERIQKEVEVFQAEQRVINEQRRREQEILKQSLSRKDYKIYAQANGIDYVRGGHGNKILLSWEYGYHKGDIDDKNSQG